MTTMTAVMTAGAILAALGIILLATAHSPRNRPRTITRGELLAQSLTLTRAYNRACQERDTLLRVVARAEGTDIQTARQKHLGDK